MWWAIGILGGVCFVAVLRLFLIEGAKKIGEEGPQKIHSGSNRERILGSASKWRNIGPDSGFALQTISHLKTVRVFVGGL
jgi:hypothetical protein